MKRREFIAGTAALLVSPRRSWAQGPPRRVGYLDGAPKNLPLYKVWQDSMRDHGWIEGKNLIIDYRSAEGHPERLTPLATELVALKPDLIVGPTPQVAVALNPQPLPFRLYSWPCSIPWRAALSKACRVPVAT